METEQVVHTRDVILHWRLPIPAQHLTMVLLLLRTADRVLAQETLLASLHDLQEQRRYPIYTGSKRQENLTSAHAESVR